MSNFRTLQLSGTESAWWLPDKHRLEIYGHGPENSIHSVQQVVQFSAEFALQLLDFLKLIEEELMDDIGVDIPSDENERL